MGSCLFANGRHLNSNLFEVGYSIVYKVELGHCEELRWRVLDKLSLLKEGV